MHTRRRVLGVLGGASLVSTSGCLDFVTGDDAYAVEAEPAQVRDSTVDETDYELGELEEEVITETFEVGSQERSVEATNWIATYEKTVEFPILGEASLGVFAVLSTPAVEFAGRTLNPVGEYDNDQLVDLLASNYEGLEVRGEAETRTYTTLGASYDASVYDAAAQFEGHDIDVFVQVGSLQHEDDFLVPLAVYPQDRADEEEPVIEALIEDIEHPSEP